MDLAEFDYDLPAERIAQVPLEPRDSALLLVDDPAGATHHHVRDLPDLLAPGDLVVVNDTRVLHARLHLRKATGGAVEVLLLAPAADQFTWEALVRPARRVPAGTTLTSDANLEVEVLADLGDGKRQVVLHHDRRDDLAAITDAGVVPLPPYIHAPLADAERYQTVYARRPASVAAPTAGLHLTDGVLSRLADRGIGVARVELEVGLGTFRPIATDRVEDHRMHAERYRVPAATEAAVAATRAAGGRVVAIGTTTLRALESLAVTGASAGSTDIYIHRPHRFASADLLLTNFHTPRSSLLVLVDAFVGDRWRGIYATALAGPYRFLSFGDAMLLRCTPPGTPS